MKLYHICDCCRQIYQTSEIEGPEGALEVLGLCPECTLELGVEPVNQSSGMHFYH